MSLDDWARDDSGTNVVTMRPPPCSGRASDHVAIARGPGQSPCQEPPRFEWVVETYTTDLMRFSLHLTGNRADANDLFQETMLKAQRAFRRLPADASHRPWLLRIANNTFLDERRRQARLTALPPEQEARLPAPGYDLAAALDARDLLVDVQAAIDLLPRKQRVSLILRKHVEASYEEIGETLRISPTAARANVYQALRKLREQFGDRL